MNAALDFGSLKKSESARVESYLGRDVICSRCDATLGTYADKCRAPVEMPCPGFLLIEGVRLHIRRKADGA